MFIIVGAWHNISCRGPSQSEEGENLGERASALQFRAGKLNFRRESQGSPLLNGNNGYTMDTILLFVLSLKSVVVLCLKSVVIDSCNLSFILCTQVRSWIIRTQENQLCLQHIFLNRTF